MNSLFKRKALQSIAAFMAINLVIEIVSPTVALALTGGPSQAEYESFEPVGASEMVNLFSGDFTYNIPLMDVDGYPVNISYHSGAKMDQEASWTGLGWNINVGAIVRNMRGLPDEFSGDILKTKINRKVEKNYGVSAGGEIEFFGIKGIFGAGASLSGGLGVSYSNYKGTSLEFVFDPNGGLTIGKKFKGGLSGGLGIKASTAEGLTFSLQGGLTGSYTSSKNTGGLGLSIGTSYNSRKGQQYMTYGISAYYGHAFNSSNQSEKGRGGKVGVGLMTSFPVGSQAYIPNLNVSKESFGYSLDLKLGVTTCNISKYGYLKGFYGEQKIKDFETDRDREAYGYMYEQNGTSKSAVHDFNREKDGIFFTETPNLPITNHTYDMYFASAQGMGSMFRNHRSDVGTVYDTYVRDNSTNQVSAGVEVGLVSTGGANIGLNVSSMDFSSESGLWDDDLNTTTPYLKFYSDEVVDNASDVPFESSYMKSAGEMNAVDASYYNSIGNLEPVKVHLTGIGDEYRADSKFDKKSGGTPITISGSTKRTQRDKRNQNIYKTTVGNGAFANIPHVINAPINQFSLDTHGDFTVSSGDVKTYADIAGSGKEHHVGEISIQNDDGSRYVYGIPVYNKSQLEMVFNVDKNYASGATNNTHLDYQNCKGLVYYSSTDDANSSNTRGVDHYFESKELPPYAAAHLLTAVLSTDYVDRTGNGPSYDDLGTYVKFNYSKLADDYKWRIPYPDKGESTKGTANFDEGFKSDPADDKGNYVYGEKAVWYLNSVETKNYMAEFVLSSVDRKDAMGVTGQDAVWSTSGTKLKKLDMIKLFSKKEIIANGSGAVPLKTVHFEYDYSLCPNVENNTQVAENVSVPLSGGGTTTVDLNANKGKLTLKKLYFTYQNSSKGKLSQYKFHYADPTHTFTTDNTYNPDYHYRASDRWGTYKPGVSGTGCNTDITPNEFPYAVQQKDLADKYSAAWQLNTIETPSGGVVKIDYEADDYAYVQDIRATQMFKIIGFNNSDLFSGATGSLYDAEGDNPLNILKDRWENNLNMFVDLVNVNSGQGTGSSGIPTSVYTSASAASEYFRNQYLAGIKDVYYRCFVNLYKYGNKFEYIPGYAEVDLANCKVDANSIVSGHYTRAIVALKPVGIADDASGNPTNPISKAAWQIGRNYLPKIIYPGSEPFSTGEPNIVGLATLLDDIVGKFTGVNRMLRSNQIARAVDVGGGNATDSKSWVRLNNPDKKKLGGGCRVSQISMNDSWSNMISGENSFEYGQTYDYTMNENGTTISSGVASYEPLVGGDEIALRKPIKFSLDHNAAPNDELYMEEPLGESLFSDAMVGYSKVTVKNIAHTNVKRHATGRTEYEFFTSKDFPYIVDKTDLEKQRVSPGFLQKLFQYDVIDKMYMSQGYLIRLNNMHGQTKSIKTYAEDQVAPVSGMTYFYKSKQGPQKRELDNTVSVINDHNQITSELIATDVDVVNDARAQDTDIESSTDQFNLDIETCFWGFPLLTYFPSFSSETNKFRSMVTTKVIQEYGVLEKVDAFSNNSHVTTENLLFDKQSGEVLLTKTINEFEDPIYNFKYPAHWAYSRMGQSYKNSDIVFKDIFDNTTGALKSTFASFKNVLLNEGDEVLVTNNGTAQTDRYWVASDCSSSTFNPAFYLIERDGDKYIPASATNMQYRIIRSGNRNQFSVPVATASSLVDPRSSNSIVFDANTKVLNASALECRNEWQLTGVTPSQDTVCTCYLNQTGHDIADFLEYLYNSGLMYSGTAIDLYDHGTFSNHFTPNLLAPFLSACPDITEMILGAGAITQSAGVITILFSVPESASELCGVVTCNLVINLPSGMSYGTGTFNADNLTTTCKTPSSLDATFLMEANYTSGGTSHTANASVTGFLPGRESCWDIFDCQTKDYIPLCKADGDIVNPYIEGIRGNWRMYKDYNYLTERDQLSTPNIQQDGAFNSYSPFWVFNTIIGKWEPIYTAAGQYDKWVRNSTISIVNPFGNVLQTQDVIDRSASALYGYNNTLSVASATNAEVRQIGFDGFEDYGYYNSTLCSTGHFDYLNHSANLSSTESHTGKFSMQVPASTTYTAERSLTPVTPACSTCTNQVPYAIKECDRIETFSPIALSPLSQKYTLSVWVKQKLTASTFTSYTDAGVNIKVNGTTVTPIATKRSLITDGWQKIDVDFEVHPYTAPGTIEVQLTNTNSSLAAYFDDIRIHPYNSSMITNVYDPVSLRLMASLDDRNFATFYEYDEEGILVRIKKETERGGIYTVKEMRTSPVKKLN